MNNDLHDRRDGLSAAAWIQGWVEESNEDPVGLFGIIASGRRSFGLNGADLEAFVRRVLRAMTEAGARPVLGGGGKGPLPWIVQPQYGSTSNEIVDSVIAEWRSMGQDPDAGGLWFATPEVYEQQRS